MTHLRTKHFSSADRRVRPLIPLRLDTELPVADDVILPTLLKAYLRQGAVICGEPYWDAAFGVADVFVLLQCDQITNRYIKHFFDRI
jgi:putative hemolysin